MTDPDRNVIRIPANAITAANVVPRPQRLHGPDHCPKCGSRFPSQRKHVEVRHPGPRGAGRGRRMPCDDRWHDLPLTTK